MNIKLLDCTLRDGGYINNWEFGEDAICDIKEKLEESSVDIIELGFIKNEPENKARTVFNNIEQAKKLIGKKQPGKEYAVMAEVINPLPLEILAPYDEDSPEIIRVIVWKRMLKEGFEYCKGIVEKGYKLCVQPARVNQYTDEEFVDMIKMFNELNPLAIYVVDSWGTMYKEELLHYLRLADKHIKEGVSVGYHGHNNLMQAFEVACAFAQEPLKRDLIIDASVYGIGRGAGNLNTELFAKWANQYLNKSYVIEPLISIYDNYISDIYNTCEKWGYSIPFYITAKYNANPNFANYYEKNGISNKLIEQCIASMTLDERIIFKEDLAEKTLRNVYKSKWNKKLAIIVISNRPTALEGYLTASAEDLYKLGIDLIVFDSAEDHSIEKITTKWANEFNNIKYHYWQGKFDGISLDNKVIDAYKTFYNDYEYLLVTRDGTPINATEVIQNIENYFAENKDLIVLNANYRDWKNIGTKSYNDVTLLFKEQCHQMTVLGSTIVKSSLIEEIIDNEPIDKEKNYGMWQPIAFFNYLADKNINAASWVGNLWLTNSNKKNNSFWHKNVLWQWGERWYKMINNLPTVYDKYKSEILKFELYDCKPFSIPFLVKSKKLGGLTLKELNKTKKYLTYVTNTPVRYFYILALLPKFLRRFARRLIILSEKIGRYNKNTPRKTLKSSDILNYESYQNCFNSITDTKTTLLLGNQDLIANPFITVFIPTYKRIDLFKEALNSVLEQKPVDFEWNIIIVDNEPYEGEPNETENYIRKLNNKRIAYYRNNKNLRPGDNFNRGISLAKAPWVMMLHDDDLLVKNSLLKMSEAIDFLSKEKGKPLGAIATSAYQFKYDPKTPKSHEKELNNVNEWLLNQPNSHKYYKLTHNNILFTSHIGGSVPSNGAIYNKAAVLKTGGFNEDYGISGDLILYYCLENNYSVYQTIEPYGFYRWGTNQMSEYKNTYKTIKDNADFREYVFNKNPLNKIFGWVFKDSLYYSFTKAVLKMRQVASNRYISYADYSDICNQHPNPILYFIWKNIISKNYAHYKNIQVKKLSKKAKKYFQNKKIAEMRDRNATNQ